MCPFAWILLQPPHFPDFETEASLEGVPGPAGLWHVSEASPVSLPDRLVLASAPRSHVPSVPPPLGRSSDELPWWCDGDGSIQVWSPPCIVTALTPPQSADPQPRSPYSGLRGEGGIRKLSRGRPQGSLSQCDRCWLRGLRPPDVLCGFGVPPGYWSTLRTGLRTVTSVFLASEELMGQGAF